MIFGIRKVESLCYRMVKKIAENFNRLSRVHQRHRQTTDGIATAYSKRNVIRSRLLKRTAVIAVTEAENFITFVVLQVVQ